MTHPDITPIPPFKALIFDCDGTLADTMPLHYRTWAETLAERGVTMSHDWYQQHGGLSSREMIAKFNQEFGAQIHEPTAIQEKQRRYVEIAPQIKELSEVAAIVREYHGKVPMAVASGGTGRLVEATLGTIGLRSYFDVVVTIDDAERGKPAPEIFLIAAERLGVAPADCIVYEDTAVGLEAARRAGMRVIDVGFLQEPSPPAPLPAPFVPHSGEGRTNDG